MCYVPPPQDWVDQLPEDEKPYVIYHTDDKGFPTEDIAWQRQQTQ
jgi:hypothetical protein